MKLLDWIFGSYKRDKKEALIKANKVVSKRVQAEECDKELYSWLKGRNKSLGIPYQ